MELNKQKQKLILLGLDRKISSLKEYIFQLKDNHSILTIQEDKDALIDACKSLEKYEELSNQIYNQPQWN